jgi:hypothetical protein
MNVEALIFQQIVDANFDQSISTASPNNTINVVQIAAKGSGTNIGLALSPKGTGYISAQVPDGTSTGGNARGARSVDLQTSRSAATQVASGTSSVCLGASNTASGSSSVAIGSSNNATGTASIAVGQTNTSSNTGSFAAGSFCNAAANSSVAMGTSCSATAESAVSLGNSNSAQGLGSMAIGIQSIAHIRTMLTHGAGAFAVQGDNQAIQIVYSGKTTTNAEVELLVNTVRGILRSGTVWHGVLQIVGSKSDGTAVASYMRQVTIKRVGNSTSLVGTVNTIGTDEAAGTSISITADDTNEGLKVAVTGVTSETWRWQAVFRGGEIVYGT